MKQYSSLRNWISSQPLMITEDGLEQIMAIIELKEAGIDGDIDQASKIFQARQDSISRSNNAVAAKPKNYAVVPLIGAISSRATFTRMSGMTSPQAFAQDILEASDNPEVDGIILHIDSPGGTVAGTPEAARAVAAARLKKPVVAFGDGLVASAAYYIASQADKIITTPETMSGSIGVIAGHMDQSRALQNAGVDVKYFRSGSKKALGQPYERMSNDVAESIQARVDDIYEQFVAAVVAGRPSLEPAKIIDMQGEIFSSKHAIANGLIDGIGDISAVLSTLTDMTNNQFVVAANGPRGGAMESVLKMLNAEGEEQAVQAIENLNARIDTLETQLLEATSNATANSITEDAYNALEARNSDLQSQLQLAERNALEAKIDLLMIQNANKIPPAERESLRQAGLDNFAWLEQHIKNKAPIAGSIGNQTQSPSKSAPSNLREAMAILKEENPNLRDTDAYNMARKKWPGVN